MNTLSVIHKTAADLRVEPNLLDYEKTRKTFTWEAARTELPGGGLNIAWETVERHTTGALRDKTAFRFLSATAPPRDLSYGDLSRLT
ncbi:MAG: acetate--CoA ligase, partial [Rugosibacter sp.]